MEYPRFLKNYPTAPSTSYIPERSNPIVCGSLVVLENYSKASNSYLVAIQSKRKQIRDMQNNLQEMWKTTHRIHLKP
jgi:hypothetical protein